MRVYRVGLLEPASDLGVAHKVTVEADARCPHDQRRAGALFAAPSLAGAVRWVLGNHLCGYNTRVRELSVDAETMRVYRVRDWERVREGRPETADAYWGAGLTLAEWQARAEDEGWDAADFEVLVPPGLVRSVRNVSAQRLLAAAPSWRVPELRRVVRRWPRLP